MTEHHLFLQISVAFKQECISNKRLRMGRERDRDEGEKDKNVDAETLKRHRNVLCMYLQ